MDDLVSKVRQIRDEATQRVKDDVDAMKTGRHILLAYCVRHGIPFPVTDDSLELVADIFGAIQGQFAITEHRKARMAAAAGVDHGRDREA